MQKEKKNTYLVSTKIININNFRKKINFKDHVFLFYRYFTADSWGRGNRLGRMSFVSSESSLWSIIDPL